MPDEAMDRVRAVKKAHEGNLMAKPNVVGVGIGYRQTGGNLTDTVALVVMVSHKLPEDSLNPKDIIPREIDGVPVDVQEVGVLRAY